jgi:DNA-binding CsgD family transcriptional regulator
VSDAGTRLVGRTAEVARSVEVAAGNTPEVAVLIEGPPGIGKTVVLQAAIDAAEAAGALVLRTRASEAELRMPLLGLHDLLAPVIPDALRSLSPPQRSRLEVALGIGSRSVGTVAPEGAAGSDGTGIDEGQLGVAVLSLLRGLASRRRVILAIDDLQWLDSSTAAVLDVALGRLREADVRVLATMRHGAEVGRLSIERLFRDRHVRLDLRGLALGELHRLIADRLDRPLPRPALVRIHEITRGNPLHALELARSLDAGGSASGGLQAALPADVGALLRHRIEALPATARDVVAVVALSPRPSNETVARALEIPMAELELRANAAVDADLLVVTDRGISLAHPLVGSAARQVVGQSGTRGIHLRLAAVAEDPDESAIHLSLGTSLPDAAVAGALEAAAGRGLARGATIDAIDQLDRTIQLTPPGHDDDLVRRRVLLVRALILAGDTRRAGAELDALGVDAIGDPRMRAEAVLLLGVVQRYLGEHAAAIARYEDALLWVTDTRTQARLHLRLAWLAEWSMASALEHADRAVALLDPDEAPLDYSFALLTGARVRLHVGIAADHAAIARGEALQAAAVERDWNVSTTPIDWAIWMEDWDRGRALLDAGARAAEEAGDETLAGALLRRRVELETWSGNLAVAAELVETAVEQAESTQQLPSIASAKSRRALIKAHLGDLDAAEREAAEAFAMAEDFGIPIILGYAATALAAAALARGNLQRVDEVVTRATAALDATGDVDQAAHRFHADHLEALIGLGQLDRARALADRLRRRGGLGPRPTWSAIAARGEAGIALAEGRLDHASEHIDRALALHGQGAVPLEHGRTLLAAAGLERRLGRRKAAAARLATALEILERIGASGWAGVARDELSRLSGGRAERHELTPSEERIATLASEGMRNREIAERLGISEKTVEAALSHAYEKLQIRSRAQLATALRRRDS